MRTSTSYTQWTAHQQLLDYFDHSNVVQDKPYSGTALSSRTDRSDIAQTVPDSTGWREPKPYSASGFSQKHWVGEAWANIYPYYYTVKGNKLDDGKYALLKAPVLSHASHPFPDWLDVRVTNRALADLKDSVVNYSVALAEANRSADLVASTAKTFVYALRDVRRGRMKSAAGRFGLSKRNFKDTFKLYKGRRGFDRQMSNRWLELQYGWTPLLADVYGVMKDVEKGFIREPRIAVTKESRHNVSSTRFLTRGTNPGFQGDIVTRTKFVSRIRLDFVLDLSTVRTLASKGLTNPALVAWELVPWSFVADWFIPVGEYLNTLDSALGLTYKNGTLTRFREDISEGELPYTSRPGGKKYSCGGSCKGYLRDFEMSRQVLQHQPGGGLYFKNPFSASHAITALALLDSTVNFKSRR